MSLEDRIAAASLSIDVASNPSGNVPGMRGKAYVLDGGEVLFVVSTLPPPETGAAPEARIRFGEADLPDTPENRSDLDASLGVGSG